MNYAEIKKNDIANGVGVRVSLFVSGCRKHCKHCFQPETWAFDFGKPFTKETENELLEALRPTYVAGLTLLGGDPMEPENQEALLPFLRKVKENFPEKDIWCFTGGIYEELVPGGRDYCAVTERFLDLVDVLVDGPFVEEQKNLRLRFRGSENQRLIDLRKTRENKALTLLEFKR